MLFVMWYVYNINIRKKWYVLIIERTAQHKTVEWQFQHNDVKYEYF